jgi:hypothetical protein
MTVAVNLTEERKVHFDIVCLALKSGTTYDNFKTLISDLLKKHLADPTSTPDQVKLDCWAINRILHRLPRRCRVRIDKQFIVYQVEYWQPPIGDPRIAINPING